MRNRSQTGFTLIELMVVVVIVAVLASIAYPQYQKYVLKARRVQAGACLQNIAQAMERYRSSNNFSYTNAAPNVPCMAELAAFYTFPAPTIPSGTTYTLQASPTTIQQRDICGTLGINQAGAKTVTGGTETDPQQCW